MSLKAQIKARLKAKFPGVNLSTKRQDAIADKLKLEDDADESAIDEKLDELNEVFSFVDMAKTDDRLRTLEAKEKKPEEPKPDADPSPADQKAPETDIAKIIAAALAPITQEFASIKAGKTTDTRKSQLESILKDTPDKFKARELKAFERMKFETDEDFEAYKTELIEDAKDSLQQQSNDGLGGFPTPIASKGASKKQLSKEEADALLDQINI